jgi:hypothetical protein
MQEMSEIALKALNLIITRSYLDPCALGSLSKVNKALMLTVREAWCEQREFVVDFIVPDESEEQLAAVLSKLAGELLFQPSETIAPAFWHSSTVFLPTASSVRKLSIWTRMWDYELKLPQSFKDWVELKDVYVNEYEDFSLELEDLIALFGTAPQLQTLGINVLYKANNEKMLAAAKALCDMPNFTCLTISIKEEEGHLDPSNCLHVCPAWESLAAAHGLKGSNKLRLAGEWSGIMYTRGRLSFDWWGPKGWFYDNVATAVGSKYELANPDWLPEDYSDKTSSSSEGSLHD